MVKDGEADMAGCTAGKDTVVADRLDFVAGDCETIRRRGPIGVLPVALDADTEFDVPWFFVLGCPMDGPKVCVGELRVRRPQPPKAEKPRGLMVSKPFRVPRGRLTSVTVNPPYPDVDQALDWGVRAVTITDCLQGDVCGRTGRCDRPRPTKASSRGAPRRNPVGRSHTLSTCVCEDRAGSRQPEHLRDEHVKGLAAVARE